MNAKVLSAAYFGLEGYRVTIEFHLSRGLPRCKIIGLPDKSVQEAKERVAAAIKSSGYKFPLQRITINLTPSEVVKHGQSFDLPIAIGILAISGQINPNAFIHFRNHLFWGELGLNGDLKQVNGDLLLIETAVRNRSSIIVAPQTTSNHSLYHPLLKKANCRYVVVSSLTECVTMLQNGSTHYSNRVTSFERSASITLNPCTPNSLWPGTETQLRALTIAVAGKHNVAMYGPPGFGKTLLAQSMTSITPAPEIDDVYAIHRIYSLSSETVPPYIPFRQPLFSINSSAMFGGGSPITPGETSLAHKGILFLDELPEFSKHLLHQLNLVIDQKVSTICVGKKLLKFPSEFQLVTAMNNCPCGNLGHPIKKCTCLPYKISKYQSHISGALWDRIPMHLDIYTEINSIKASAYTSLSMKQIRNDIQHCLNLQRKRGIMNKDLTLSDLSQTRFFDSNAQHYIKESAQRLGLSIRAVINTGQIARTIADLAGNDTTHSEHIEEALSYRKRILTL